MGRYKWDKTNHVLIPISSETSNFTGTTAEWNALSASEKANYKTVDLTDDFNGVAVIDNLTTTTSTGEPLSAHMGNTLGSLTAYINTNTSTASKAYSAGEQFVLNGSLCKAKTAITSGANLTLNSNYEYASNVTSQISNLESKLLTSNLLDLSPYTGASLISEFSANDLIILNASGGNRVTDLPVVQAGMYIVTPNMFYIRIIFIGTNGCVYIYDRDGNWVAIITK